MFKILKILLLSVVLTLLFYSSSTSVEKSTIDSIISYANNVEQGEYNNFEVYKIMNTLLDGTKVETTLLRSKENTSKHNYFDWKWTLHVLKVFSYPTYTYSTSELEIISRDYQDFATIRSRGFEEWGLTDINVDGKVDFVYREYMIVICDDDEEDCANNHIIMPYYPKGFINKNWYSPSKEESQKRYDKEVDYWTKIIWGQKNN